MKPLTKATYQTYLKEKGYFFTLPTNRYSGGRVSLTSISKEKNKRIYISYYEDMFDVVINEQTDCCGAKLIHGAPEGHTKEQYMYLIGAALLWCKINKNTTAIYYVSSKQPKIEEALCLLGFKCVNTVYNPKSHNTYSLYVINPLEL